MANTILLGAVAYDPKVVTIWEGIRDYFRGAGVPLDFALFSNYERQVEMLLAGHIDIAWNTPLGHVRVQRRTGGALALARHARQRSRLPRQGRGAARRRHPLARRPGRQDAGGRQPRLDAGAHPAAALPRRRGRRPRPRCSCCRSTPIWASTATPAPASSTCCARSATGGRRRARSAIWSGSTSRPPAGSTPRQLEVLWTTPGFDHCMFDAMPALSEGDGRAFQHALFAMSWEEPSHRRLLELEGLRQWLPPREEGYESLRRALDQTQGW